jgi:DNA-binding transcriptional regulator LsrR (DeoR family)
MPPGNRFPAMDGPTIGITLSELKTIPGRLCVVGGVEKFKPNNAAPRVGNVERLVTDAEGDTASGLLAN